MRPARPDALVRRAGRGHRVVTPLTPTDWRLTYDGETVSLEPSIGNWSAPCRSHYWIARNRVDWAGMWSQERIEVCRRHDRLEKARYFDEPYTGATHQHEVDAGLSRRWIARMFARVRGGELAAWNVVEFAGGRE